MLWSCPEQPASTGLPNRQSKPDKGCYNHSPQKLYTHPTALHFATLLLSITTTAEIV